MSDLPAIPRDAISASRQNRDPTKLECGLLGALSATIVLALLLWLGVQLSLLKLIIQIT